MNPLADTEPTLDKFKYNTCIGSCLKEHHAIVRYTDLNTTLVSVHASGKSKINFITIFKYNTCIGS